MNVLVLGTFDGVHLGHQFLIEYALGRGNVIACSFLLPPATVKGKVKALTTAEEKTALLKKYGVNEVFLQDFSSVCSLSAEEYLENLCKRFSPKQIVVGIDHRFGKNALGNAKTLIKNEEKYGYKTVIVPPKTDEEGIISSSSIRELISMGEVKKANKRLGHTYYISGEVVGGKGIGKTFNFPTANILTDKEKLLLKNGVYATKTLIDGILYNSMTNIGFNPTVSGEKLTVETNIFNLSKDIYGKKIKIYFYSFVREDKKFDSVSELKKQLENDAILINAYLNSNNKIR